MPPVCANHIFTRPKLIKQEQTSVIKRIICPSLFCSMIHKSVYFSCGIRTGRSLYSCDPVVTLRLCRLFWGCWFFSLFSHKSPTCCCIHNDRRFFFCVCLFMVIQKDMVGFFKHLRLPSVCAISMWAFIIETCCVQPLNGFNLQTTAPAVIRCQVFTEMFLMVFLRWHHGSLFRPLWVSTVQLKLCCFSWLLLFHCE